MADLKIFVILVMVLVSKEGAFSCSLRSHKHGSSHPCLPSTSDSTSDTQLTPVLNTINSPSDSSSNPSSSLSNVYGNGSAISSTPTISPDMSSQGSIPSIPPAPSVPADNMDILNSLIQLLSSPAFSTLHASKTQIPDKSVLPSTSTSDSSQSTASISKSHSTSLPCAPASSSSSSSSILPANPPCGSIPSILNTIQIPKLSHSVSTPSSGTNLDLTNSLIKISSLVPSAPYLSTSKPTPLSPPCSLLYSALNKNVVPDKKPCAISHRVGPPLSVLPGVLRGSPSSSNRSVQIPVSEKLPAPVPERGPKIAPEEFPAPSNVPVSIPIVTSTSTPTSFSNINPAFIDLLRQLLVASQVKTGLSFPPIPTKTHVTPTMNAAPVSAPNIKPHTISPACGTSSESSNSCSSSILHNKSNGSISRLQQILMSMTPPVSDITFGYNPEFMKLLIKNLLSNQNSSLPSLSPLYSLLHFKLNTTPIVPLAPNPIPASTTYRPLSELNPNVFNTSSNNTFDSAPAGSDTNQNTSISNDQYLTNILINLLTSSNASKTSLLPCLPSTNSDSISTLNTTPVSSVPCIPPLSSLPDILGKFPKLTTSTNPSFPGLIPSPIIPSLPNIKPFSERVQDLNPVPTLTPTSYPLLPKSDINLCRSKHKGSLQLPGSTSTAVDPCLQNAIQPHTPHLPLPCSLSHTKLSSGCKHVIPAI